MTVDPNTLETIRKNVNQFFNSLLEEGFLNENLTGFDEKTRKKIDSTHKRHDLEFSLFNKIIKANEKYHILTDDEFSVFGFKHNITRINEDIEIVKMILKATLNHDKIIFNDNTTYGQLLGFCFDKLHYDQTRPIMRDAFLIDFRNAYTHLQYEINGDEFSFTKSNGSVVKVDVDGLGRIQREYIETLETLKDFLTKNYLNSD